MKFKNVYIKPLDGIRGFAVLFVVIHHIFLGISDFVVLPEMVKAIAVSGVDLFFILSGFLIGGIIIDEHKNKTFWKKFMLRRVGRIFPVYFLVIGTFAIAIQLFQHKWFLDEFLFVDPLPITPYFAFMQSYFQGVENVSGPKWVAMTWTLSVEEQFYLVLPFIAILFSRKGIYIAIFIAIVIAPVIRHWLFSSYGFYAGYMFFPARMDTLAMGVLVAILVRHDMIFHFLKKSKLLYLIPLIFFFLLNEKIYIGMFEVDKFTFRAIFYASIVLILVSKKNFLITLLFENKIIVFFGAISFGLYMYHQLVNGLLHGLIYNSAPSVNTSESLIVAGFVFITSVLLAVISLKYFEHPIRGYFKNKTDKFESNT